MPEAGAGGLRQKQKLKHGPDDQKDHQDSVTPNLKELLDSKVRNLTQHQAASLRKTRMLAATLASAIEPSQMAGSLNCCKPTPLRNMPRLMAT